MTANNHKLLLLEDSTDEAREIILCSPVRRGFVGSPNIEIPALPDLSELKGTARTSKKSRPDALDFLQQRGIARFSDLSRYEPKDLSEVLNKASVVIVQRIEDALEVVRQARFDLVISDLFLFDPKLTNADPRPQSLSDFPLFERCEQIKRPSGLRFIHEIRDRKSDSATSPDVPVVVMTLFWTHPRFNRYIDEIRSYKPAVGYLPKYFKTDNKSMKEEVGDPTLELLIDLLRDKSALTERLVPVLFRVLGLELFAHSSRLKSHKALYQLHESQNDFVRSIIDFTLIFEVMGLAKPADTADEFDHIVAGILNDSVTGEVTFRFHVYNPDTWEPHLPSPSGTLFRFPPRRTSQLVSAKRQFIVLLALAVYTYPLAEHPHAITIGEIIDIMTKFGLSVSEDDIRQDMYNLRRSLQKSLPRELFKLASAKNHILVSDGHSGYYLNGEHEIRISR